MLINVTLPVFNEERRLARSLPRLHAFLVAWGRFPFELVVADNGSTDHTLALARQLAREYSGVRVEHLELKGRGRALKQVWRASRADILSYMDVDLSTDLDAFPLLVAALVDGGYELAIGSRRLPASRTSRGWRREILSRGYMLLVKTLFRPSFSDAQCGFKALTGEAAAALLPLVVDDGWFMDTELLVLAERLGYRIGEVPVQWVDDPDSRVRLFSTALADLRGLLRLRWGLAAGKYPSATARCRAAEPRGS